MKIFANSKLKVYHGGNKKFSQVDPKFMLTEDSNAQEGIGIYFSNDKEVADAYGKFIMSTEIDLRNFVDSNDLMRDHVVNDQIFKILKDMWKVDAESLFYLISDYIYITEPDEIEDFHLEELASFMADEQIRNFQYTIADKFGVENLVKSWNKNISKIHGTYGDQDGDGKLFIAIINTKYKITQEN